MSVTQNPVRQTHQPQQQKPAQYYYPSPAHDLTQQQFHAGPGTQAPADLDKDLCNVIHLFCKILNPEVNHTRRSKLPTTDSGPMVQYIRAINNLIKAL
ncbi:protein of unknown function [Taphrina deformans PYCC 5710]|uniref:Uncharacterized protein n=1 Tax=Taphrina deformans (strain PYCC 5710 / ATCC 11124 / CBS 356.35 / IMI 108563 / JCM 9778 / NBRC 8474) TaxID=1097556 RepID=R4XCH4_TAPDE|nr:protein of unknown function [Taphrina deformans PYCC 5710]|eukprot:CCG81020.1 protein of unknown function [Taphrina deformans PYCC 5710]